MQLKELQAVGAVASSLDTVSMVGVFTKSVNEVLTLTAEEKAELNCVVTVDNPQWVATARRKPPQEAASVFSCDNNGNIGCWKKKDGTFLLMRLNKDRLETIKIIKMKEGTRMPGLDVNATDPMAGFEDILGGGASAPESPKETGKGTSERTAKREAIERDIEKIRSMNGDVSIGNTDDMVLQNHQYGKLIAFITKTDNVLKVSKRKRAKTDKEGNRIADPVKAASMPDSVKKKINEGKNIPMAYCETEKYLAFTDAKPGKIVGVVIATPVGSEVQLTKLSNTKEFQASDNKDLVYRILSIETAYNYVAANYGDNYSTWINEDPAVVGPSAGKVYLKYKYSEKKDEKTGKITFQTRASFCLERKEAKRKTLLTANNFFPAKLYKTLPLDGASAEDKAIFNVNIAAALKADGSFESLADDSKSKLTLKDDGTYESAWFNNGEKIDVAKFDANDAATDKVLAIKVPVRTAKTNKSGTGMTYSYEYIALGEEGGPQDQPVYKNIIKASNFSTEDFIAKVEGIVSTSSKTRSTSRPQLGARDFLAAKISGSIDTGVTRSIAQLAEEIATSGNKANA